MDETERWAKDQAIQAAQARCDVRGLAIDDLHRETCQLARGHSGPHRIAKADAYGRTFVEWDESAINALKRRTCPVCNVDGVHAH